MLYFEIPKEYVGHEKWLNQLKEWCVGYKFEVSNTIITPVLKEGDKEVLGEKNIDQFLKEYKTFMDEWYDCRCDKWMEE